MRPVRPHRPVIALVVCVLGCATLAATLPAAAQPRDDGLDTPLTAANRCGAGVPGATHFTFAATGDTFPHENIQAVGEAQGYDLLFDYVRPFLQAADVAYTNFDGAMLEGSPYTGYPAFNFNPRLATALKNAGIGVVSTANNHILDRGPAGLDATLEVLAAAGIQQHGAVATSAADQPRSPYLPITLTRDGVSVTIGFLAFTWGTNGLPDPYGQVNLLWRSNEYGRQGGVRPEVLAAIAQAQRETDLVIVAAHWGYEYQFYPDASQIEGARQMAAAGADVILGAQSHTLQPVDLIETEGRTTLVIYSLANFLASQGAFQTPYFSATSVIFYVGIVREADGTVRVSGYRYLPTIHVDADTRPAPIPAQGYEPVISHVRLMMRDFDGARQVAPDPAALGSHLAVCPVYSFAAAPDYAVGGDFAQHLATLGGGVTPRSLTDAIAVFGYPLGPVVQEPTGDCQATTSVLYTERQRLEWHPQAAWPGRVIGTQVGTAVYRQRYGVAEPARLALEQIANEPFRRFYATYGGLPVFGYPISAALTETDPATGQARLVQYFERARFELTPDAPLDADLPAQVGLGLLGREYPGIAGQCGGAEVAATPPGRAPGSAVASAPGAPALVAPPAAAKEGSRGWLLALIVLDLLLLAGVMAWGVQSYRAERRWRERLRRRRERER